jgi:hypothetical protein
MTITFCHANNVSCQYVNIRSFRHDSLVHTQNDLPIRLQSIWWTLGATQHALFDLIDLSCDDPLLCFPNLANTSWPVGDFCDGILCKFLETSVQAADRSRHSMGNRYLCLLTRSLLPWGLTYGDDTRFDESDYQKANYLFGGCKLVYIFRKVVVCSIDLC